MPGRLFNLIAVGRGKVLKEITPEECERLHHWVYELSKRSPFIIGTTEAPHYRRVALARMKAEGMSLNQIRQTAVGRGFGIRDGNGVMFISHTGEVYPSGFLPVTSGKCAYGPCCGHLPKFTSVQNDPANKPTPGQVWAVRVQRDLWWLAGKGLCNLWRLSGGGSSLQLSASPKRRVTLHAA